jgi:hypothetical protein
MSGTKELRFFTKHWHRGVDWYESMFQTDRPVRGESSPQYSLYPMHPEVPVRMHSVVPDARLIYLVRDPIERLISHYMERLGQFREHRELASILAQFESNRHAQNQYIGPSRYWLQIQRYLTFYPPDRILVVALDDLKHRRQEMLRRIFGFVGADEHFVHEAFGRVWNESLSKRRKSWVGRLVYPERLRRSLHRREAPYPLIRGLKTVARITGKPIERPVLPAALESRLVAAFRADVAGLKAFTGQNFGGWREY